MKGQYYRIDWDTCDRLHLYGREAMVYCALIYLCKKAPYKGSATELASFSHCGTYMTALRMLDRLQEKGLISIESDGIRITQIVQTNTQSVQTNTQSVQISKEKSTKKEIKIKNKNNVCISSREEKTHTAASPNIELINRLFFMDTLIPADKQAIPANTGYYKIIVLEYGYLNPKRFVNEFYNHWEGKGWPKNGNKLFLMRSWMDKYITIHHKEKPNLDETERIVLKTFLDNIEQRLIVRLFNVITGFDVYEKKIVFTVKNENVNDFAKWLDSLPLAKIFAAYNRIVTVQPYEKQL